MFVIDNCLAIFSVFYHLNMYGWTHLPRTTNLALLAVQKAQIMRGHYLFAEAAHISQRVLKEHV